MGGTHPPLNGEIVCWPAFCDTQFCLCCVAEGKNGGNSSLPADGAGRGMVKEERSGRFNLLHLLTKPEFWVVFLTLIKLKIVFRSQYEEI